MNEKININSHIQRSSLLNLCKGFYSPYYVPKLDKKDVEGITFDTIGYLKDEMYSVDNPEIVDISLYISNCVQSHQMLSCSEKAFEKITFAEYSKKANGIVEKLKSEYESLTSADMDSDSMADTSMPSYPLQHRNIFFYDFEFDFIPESGTAPADLHKKFTKILKDHGLTEFRQNIFKRDDGGSSDRFSAYYIPKESVFSLTYLLLAFQSDMPYEIKCMALMDFVINACVASRCELGGILSYLLEIKKNLSLEKLCSSRGKILSNLQKKAKESIDDLIRNISKEPDSTNLFWEFSREQLGLYEKYFHFRDKIELFRKIEKHILDGERNTDDCLENYFIQRFEYENRSFDPISFEELYDLLIYGNNMVDAAYLHELKQRYPDSKKTPEFHGFYDDNFFAHLA